jgi:hypothetical protein
VLSIGLAFALLKVKVTTNYSFDSDQLDANGDGAMGGWDILDSLYSIIFWWVVLSWYISRFSPFIPSSLNL